MFCLLKLDRTEFDAVLLGRLRRDAHLGAVLRVGRRDLQRQQMADGITARCSFVPCFRLCPS